MGAEPDHPSKCVELQCFVVNVESFLSALEDTADAQNSKQLCNAKKLDDADDLMYQRNAAGNSGKVCVAITSLKQQGNICLHSLP